jgi:hypothetical protein
LSLKPPILVIGSMRAGKSTLAAVLAELPGMCTWMEPSMFLSTGHAFRDTDCAGADDAKPWVRRHMRSGVLRYQQDHDDARVIIEGPSATFKIPFLHAVFPEAKFIHIYRDGRVVMRERLADEASNRQFPMVSTGTFSRVQEQLRYTNWRDLLALPIKTSRTLTGRMSAQRWYGPRYPGWRESRAERPSEIAAKQWASAVEHALRDLPNLPPQSWTNVRCEKLLEDPATELRRLVEFCDVRAEPEQIALLKHSLLVRSGMWAPGSPDDDAIRPLLPIMRPQLERLGYMPPESTPA